MDQLELLEIDPAVILNGLHDRPDDYLIPLVKLAGFLLQIFARSQIVQKRAVEPELLVLGQLEVDHLLRLEGDFLQSGEYLLLLALEDIFKALVVVDDLLILVDQQQPLGDKVQNLVEKILLKLRPGAQLLDRLVHFWCAVLSGCLCAFDALRGAAHPANRVKMQVEPDQEQNQHADYQNHALDFLVDCVVVDD